MNKYKTKFLTFAFLAALVFGVGEAQAHEMQKLIVKNNSGTRLFITVTNINCYEGTPNGGDPSKIDDRDQLEIDAWRVQGHGCNGRQGEFLLTFSPGNGPRVSRAFNFDNDGGAISLSDMANPYPGTLTQAAPKLWIFSTKVGVREKLVGRWIPMCNAGFCQRRYTSSISSTSGKSESNMAQKVRVSFETSMKGGLDFGGGGINGSARGSVNTETNTRNTDQFLSEISDEKSDLDMSQYSNEYMAKNNIAVIWQWVLSNSSYTYKTNSMTCTATAAPPNWTPASVGHERACIGR